MQSYKKTHTHTYHLCCHHLKELIEINCTCRTESTPSRCSQAERWPSILFPHTWSIFINVGNHFPDFFLLRLKSKSTHGNLHPKELVPWLGKQLGGFHWGFTFSSLASIVPEPSESNKSKASLISCFCSSVSSFLGAGRMHSTQLIQSVHDTPPTTNIPTLNHW